MTWNLFIDDERFPPDDGKEWIICRTRPEVYAAIHSKGIPSYISFDHDLGEDEGTGFDIAKMIVDMDLDEYRIIPEDFDFYVHSQNPVGKKNIELLLVNYLQFKHR